MPEAVLDLRLMDTGAQLKPDEKQMVLKALQRDTSKILISARNSVRASKKHLPMMPPSSSSNGLCASWRQLAQPGLYGNPLRHIDAK